MAWLDRPLRALDSKARGDNSLMRPTSRGRYVPGAGIRLAHVDAWARTECYRLASLPSEGQRAGRSGPCDHPTARAAGARLPLPEPLDYRRPVGRRPTRATPDPRACELSPRRRTRSRPRHRPRAQGLARRRLCPVRGRLVRRRRVPSGSEWAWCWERALRRPPRKRRRSPARPSDSDGGRRGPARRSAAIRRSAPRDWPASRRLAGAPRGDALEDLRSRLVAWRHRGGAWRRNLG